MVKLLVDIGNTGIRWSDPEGLSKGRVHGGLIRNLNAILSNEWWQMERPDSLWVSNVAGREVSTTLSEWSQRMWDVKPVYLKSTSQAAGVQNGYQEPDQLGVDRWLAMVAAYSLSNQPLVVVDCGTATTIDAVDAQGQHYGGLILPGLRSMRETLQVTTAIPDYTGTLAQGYFATNTAAGIRSGAVVATACSVQRVWSALQEQTGQTVVCMVTGGGASEIMEALDMPVRHEPNLVLNGLALMAK